MLYFRLLRELGRVTRERNQALYEAVEHYRRKRIAQELLADERAHNAELEAQLSVANDLLRNVNAVYGPFRELERWSETVD